MIATLSDVSFWAQISGVVAFLLFLILVVWEPWNRSKPRTPEPRAATISTTSAGGAFIPEDYSEALMEQLRAEATLVFHGPRPAPVYYMDTIDWDWPTR